MFSGRHGSFHRSAPSKSLLLATAVVGTLASAAFAQTPPPAYPQGTNVPTGQQPVGNQGTGQVGNQAPAPADTEQSSAIMAIIQANLAQPQQICAACTPLIVANPALAAEIIAAAKQYPELAEQLAQCLSKIQQSMSVTNPEGAQKIAALVAGAPPAFQAAYAVALAPGGGADGGGADGGGADGGGGAGGGGAGAGGGGGLGGGGGGGAAGGGLTSAGNTFSTSGGPLASGN